MEFEYPNLRAAAEYDGLVDDAVERRDWYQQHGDWIEYELPCGLTVDVLTHSHLDPFIDLGSFYERLESMYGTEPVDDAKEQAEKLADAANRVLSFDVKHYARDIAGQVAGDESAQAVLVKFVQEFVNQFGIWYYYYESEISDESAEVHNAIDRLRGHSHLSKQAIRNMLDERGW